MFSGTPTVEMTIAYVSDESGRFEVYVASADGQRFLINTEVADSRDQLMPVTGVVNWTAEFKR